MTTKLPKKYKDILFALIMSFSTGFIVSGIISLVDHATVTEWLRAFAVAWPIVFLSIIAVAPSISRFVDRVTA